MVQAALLTGARYSELANVVVGDFRPEIKALHVRFSKSGKARFVALTEEGAEYFASLVAGRSASEPLLRHSNGEPWKAAQQGRPMAVACTRANLVPPASFHCLRHTYASLAIMGGAPLFVAAKNLGHADTRMVELHYGHLAPSYLADAIRAAVPCFGIETSSRVRALVRS